MKRLAIIFCSMLITINTLPVIAGNFVFADSIPSGFTQVDNEADQVEAFKYYCKSRNLAIEGSVLDAVTQVTTKAYQTAVNAVSSEIGFDINSLQNELYKRNTSSGQEFFYTASGINAMNRIFAEFLQNNNLAVGDEVENKEIFSGRWFVDADGNGCQVGTATSTGVYPYVINPSSVGSTYIYTWEDIKNLVSTSSASFTLHLTSSYTYTYTLYYFNNSNYTSVTTTQGSYNPIANWGWAHRSGATHTWEFGDNGIVLNTSNGKLYFGYYKQVYIGDPPTVSSPSGGAQFIALVEIPSGTTQQANVYLTTNNTTINNNTYEGDTIIKNNGQTQKPNPPIPDPNDDHNSTTDPITPSDPDSDSNLTFPLLDLDLPSVDWSIGDLSNKFPFSIPFDLYNMFSVLNTEPQTPEIKGNIDLGIYQWDIEWDLHQFDDTAELLRNVEFVGFIIGLIFITRSLIKG